MTSSTQKDGDDWARALTNSRIGGLDLLRGLALLGILLANVHQMLMPWEIANEPVQFTGSDTTTLVDWFLLDSLVMSKFLTVFSLLFGIGFGLQVASLKARQNGRFRMTYLRRIAVLGLFGVLHGMYLYGADVLLYYAITGFVLLWLCEWRARTLMLYGLGLTLMVLLVGFALNWGDAKSPLVLLAGILLVGITTWIARNGTVRQVMMRSLSAFALAATVYGISTPADFSDGKRWNDLRTDAETAWQMVTPSASSITLGGQQVDIPISAEDAARLATTELDRAERMALSLIAYRHGPASLADALRTDQFIQIQIGFILFYFWRTLAIFMIGLGLVKWGLFQQVSRGDYRKVFRWGLIVGLPLSLAATALKVFVTTVPGHVTGIGFLLHEVSVYPLAAALVAGTMLWASSSAWQRMQHVISSAGRMALTNYLAQSAVMLWLAAGLGLFGSLTRAEQSLLAVAVFTGLALLSYLWLMRFKMGPMEKLWRIATYGWRR